MQWSVNMLCTRALFRFRKYFLIWAVIAILYMAFLTTLCTRTPDNVDFIREGQQIDPVQSCSSRSDAWRSDYVYHHDEYNTAWPWNSTIKWGCPTNYYKQYSLHRRKVQLDCSGGSPRLVTTQTDSPSDIQIVEPRNACLKSFVETCCYDKGMRVPNLMHYVWYADVELRFYAFVSFMSVIRFMRPCVILLHGPYVPRGEFWNFFISVYPNVILVNESLVTEVFGKKLAYPQHGADVMRLNALLQFGGLYMDLDEVLIKSIDPFRNYSCVMSKEKDLHLGNQFILAERQSYFLKLWLKGYRMYLPSKWEFNSIIYPYGLARKHKTLIHVEEFTFLKPKQKDDRSLWYANSDWSNNYALHVYLRSFKDSAKLNMDTIRTENTTIGAIFRRILFGRKELCTS